MKNLLLPGMIAVVVVMTACNSGSQESAGSQDTHVHEHEHEVMHEGIGFNTVLPELKWHLGTETAIQVVKDFDKLWASEDYEGMKGLFADTAVMYFPDGKTARSPEDILQKIQDDDHSSEVDWTFDYAFSVDLDPSRGGEHVQAGFTVTSLEDGKKTKKRYHESYYIIEGKIVMLTQYTAEVLKEE